MPNFKVSIIPAGNGPVTIHDIKGEDGPSFKEIYPLINADMIEIVEGKWNDVKDNIIFDCDLYCDEEGRLTGKQHNWRASQLRFNKLKPDEDNLLPGWRDHCNIVGDVAMVIEDDGSLELEATG
tara:strand:+ start:74 stop:445 length:372 start_codon:yes stop_codon:yes gene_type:complete